MDKSTNKLEIPIFVYGYLLFRSVHKYVYKKLVGLLVSVCYCQKNHFDEGKKPKVVNQPSFTCKKSIIYTGIPGIYGSSEFCYTKIFLWTGSFTRITCGTEKNYACEIFPNLWIAKKNVCLFAFFLNL